MPKPGFRLFHLGHDWWNDLTEGQRDLCRLVLVIVVLGVVVGAAYFFGRPYWQRWRHHQALSQAENFALKHDYRNAVLALQRATQLAPMDLTTWRETARILAEIGSPQALVARENLVRLAPQDMSLRLALVAEALRFGESRVARGALDGFNEAAQRDAAFHRLAAALAMALHESREVEAHLAAVVKADPADTVAKFDLASIQLWGADEERAKAARAQLEQLVDDPSVRIRASLELLKDAARTASGARADAVVKMLLGKLQHPKTPVPDAPGSAPGWLELVASLETTAAASGPGDAALVARWLTDVRQRREALRWIDTLPEALQKAPALADAAAQLQAEAGNLERLEALLRAGAWGPVPEDVVRLAITSRIQGLRYEDAHGRGTWDDALSACGDSMAGYGALARLAEAWHDPDRAERALLAVLTRFPKTQWAFFALRNHYIARGDTAKLLALYSSRMVQQPNELDVLRTWIHLSVVLDRATPDVENRARSLYSSDPSDPANAAAYAAVLWRKGQNDKAAGVLESILPMERSRPDVAFWIALVLAKMNHPMDALVAAQRAYRPDLSREELELLQSVLPKPNTKASKPSPTGNP